MGQIISRKSSFEEYVDLLRDNGHNVGLLMRGEDTDDEDEEEEEQEPSVYITVPIDEALLNSYTLNDLDQLIRDELIVWVTPDSYICSHELEFDLLLGMGYHVLEILVNFTDSSTGTSSSSSSNNNNRAQQGPKKYQIYSSDHEDAEMIVNGILHLMKRTEDFKDCIEIQLKTKNEENCIDQPLNIDRENFYVLLNRFNKNKNCYCKLVFHGIIFNTEQCAMLSSNIFPDHVKLKLYNFQFDNNDECNDVFVNGIANNYGPNKLFIKCHNNDNNLFNSTLCIKICNALSHQKNSRLKELRLHFGLKEDAYNALCTMLQTNIGLVALTVYIDTFNKDLIFQSLHNHPTLQQLWVELLLVDPTTMTNEGKKLAMEPIIEMLKYNHIINEINLDRQMRVGAYDKDILRTEIRQYLKINKKRPQIKEIHDITDDEIIRSMLIGLFLEKNHNDLNLIWLVVRDNNLLIIDKIQKFFQSPNKKLPKTVEEANIETYCKIQQRCYKKYMKRMYKNSSKQN